MSKKKNLPILENIEITDFAAEGKSLARIDNMVVFVPFVVPGDVVDIKVTRKKHSFMEGKAIYFHKYSEFRTNAMCPHFGICGGCKWQTLDYNKQLEFKQIQVVDNLKRIGKVDIPSVRNIIGAKQIKEYRNKLEFSFSNKRWLTEKEIAQKETYNQMNAVGFHIPGAFDKVLDIEDCKLMIPIQNSVRIGIKEFAIANNISFFDLRQQVGVLRNISFRSSNSGEIMLTIQFHFEDKQEEKQAMDVLEYVSTSFPEITTIIWVNNLKCNDTIGDLDLNIYKGEGFVYELMEDLKFKVGPKSFYQTNNEQAYKLYSAVRDFCDLTGEETVYDLYTGTGTIANFVASKAKKVIGIEYVPEAIEDAKENSAINKIDNTIFYAGDMKDVLNREFVEKHGKPDVIITDPPRVGMHKDVVDVILATQPQRIVYVSCNPATQARDIELMKHMYDLCEVQPVDMFPHTHHVENIVLMKLKQQA